MGRPRGGGIYDGDAASDFYSTITGRLERELAYWLSPENIMNDGSWLEKVMAVIEAMLLLDQHESGSTVYLADQGVKAVERWRETFLHVWDGDWKTDNTSPHLSDDLAYRQRHRLGIISLFDRLDSLAREWMAVGTSSERSELTPLHSNYPLPYFSFNRWISRDNTEVVNVERFTYNLLESLVKDIMYFLSPEKRAEVSAFNVEEVWVAADVLAFLCVAYEQSPGINEQVVRKWRETTIDIEKQFLGDAWDELDGLYQEVLGVFDRLETVARKYPPFEWWTLG